MLILSQKSRKQQYEPVCGFFLLYGPRLYKRWFPSGIGCCVQFLINTPALGRTLFIVLHIADNRLSQFEYIFIYWQERQSGFTLNPYITLWLGRLSYRLYILSK